MTNHMKLTHLNDKQQPGMVAVGDKAITRRTATARARVRFPDDVLATLAPDGATEIRTAKGSVFDTAILAGTMAVKQTHQLIPLCHPIPLEGCRIVIDLKSPAHVQITCTVEATHKTGVEMEALTGVTVAALTLYDMCKALTHGMVIEDVKLVEKTGGKSDYHDHG